MNRSLLGALGVLAVVGCGNAFAEAIQITNGIATMTLPRKLATGTVTARPSHSRVGG